MNAVLVFCEGNHDVRYTVRCLGVIRNADWVGAPIRDLPAPFGPVHDPNNPHNPKIQSIIIRRYLDRSLDTLHLQAAVHPPLPSFEAIVKDTSSDTLYVIIKSHGDRASAAAITLLHDVESLLLPGFGADIQKISAAFVYDADNGGVSQREAEFASEYASILNGAKPSHKKWLHGKTFPVGLYVFHDEDTQQGTLEDILAPLVKATWIDRWQAAGHYLDKYKSPSDPVTRKHAEYIKAQSCITGQFLFPGDPMTRIFDKRGLPDSCFDSDQPQAFVDFLTRVPW